MNATFIFLLLLFSIFNAVQAQTDSLYLWPGEVPDESKPKSAPVPSTLEDGSIRVIEMTNPFIAVFEPKPSRKNGKAIIVCPGGAYVRLAVHKEGYATADFLSDLGYTVFVLHYRVPDKRDGALQDLQRAIRLVRQRAKEYGIDPAKVGAMGFSAGGHLVTRAVMEEAKQRYPLQDEADKLSAMPDKMIIIYPGYLSDGPNKSLSPGLTATPNIPETFIFQTMDDGSALSAFALATALQKVKANVELHMLPIGGHGYGMYPGNKAAEAWPILLERWLHGHL